MARLPRLSLPDLPHHVLQIGNNRQAIFLDDQDRQAWRDALREASLNAGVDVHAYVLMDDHVHLLATPRGDAEALGAMMQSLGRRYVAGFNRRHGRTGTLWEGRYRAALVEPGPALLACMRYIDTHASRLPGLMEPADWPWSSAAHHLGRTRDPLITDHASFWALGNTPFERDSAWRRYCEEGVRPQEADALITATRRGWPIGSEAFRRQLSATMGRSVSPKPRGRPRLVREAATLSPLKIETQA